MVARVEQIGGRGQGLRPRWRDSTPAGKASATTAASAPAAKSQGLPGPRLGAGRPGSRLPQTTERAQSPAPATTGAKAKGQPRASTSKRTAAREQPPSDPSRAQPEDREEDGPAKEKPAEDTVVDLRRSRQGRGRQRRCLVERPRPPRCAPCRPSC
ncbi:hypothetical protein QJS66_23175 [Kocuria rhizophila]|nr:hypothetical protein QJS66_23175 [Kocuria rhizophila]